MWPFAIHRVTPHDLQDRLSRTRLPQEIPGIGWKHGVPLAYVRRLMDYWCNGYDWHQWEAKLNAYPQFTTEIDGQNIHFLHVRSPEPDALALILTHGWPGSVFEFFKVIEPLTKILRSSVPVTWARTRSGVSSGTGRR